MKDSKKNKALANAAEELNIGILDAYHLGQLSTFASLIVLIEQHKDEEAFSADSMLAFCYAQIKENLDDKDISEDVKKSILGFLSEEGVI